MCLASPSRLSSQVCNSQRVEVISQRVEEIDCLANLRIPGNPLFSLYRFICAPVMNHMQPFLCYCPKCLSLCKSTLLLLMFLKSKTKFACFFFLQAEYFYEFQTLRSLDKDIMDDPTVNVPLLGSVPHKASGLLLFHLFFIYFYFI